MNRKSCENCTDGIRCRACGSELRPLPGLLSGRDYLLVLALIDGSDRKYAPRVLDTVAQVLKLKRGSAKNALHRLRAKLRQLLEAEAAAGEGTRKRKAAPAKDPVQACERIKRRAKAGEISWDQAIQEMEALR